MDFQVRHARWTPKSFVRWTSKSVTHDGLPSPLYDGLPSPSRTMDSQVLCTMDFQVRRSFPLASSENRSRDGPGSPSYKGHTGDKGTKGLWLDVEHGLIAVSAAFDEITEPCSSQHVSRRFGCLVPTFLQHLVRGARFALRATCRPPDSQPLRRCPAV